MTKRCRWVIALLLLTSLPVLANEPGSENEPKPEAEEVEATEPLSRDDDVIVVTGSRTSHRLADSPIATELITRREIEESGATNAAEILEAHPGVDMSSSFNGTGLRLQGLDAKHVLILLDGERVGGRVGGVVDLNRLSVEAIDRIEVVKGPASALYGSDAMGGVVHILTRGTRRPLEAVIKGSYGSFNQADLSGRFGFRVGPWDSRFVGGWHQVDAFDLNPEDLATTGRQQRQFNVSNRTTYEANPNFKVIARADYLQRDQQGIDNNAAGAIFDRRNLTEVVSGSLKLHRKLNQKQQLKLGIGTQLFKDQFVYDQRRSNRMDKDEQTLEFLNQASLQFDQRIGDHHLLVIGTEGFLEQLESPRIKDGSGEVYRGALFIQDEWTITRATSENGNKMLVLVPGARLDTDSQFGHNLAPKMAIRYDPNKKLKLRLSYGMGFRAPVLKEQLLVFENPNERYIVEGNPDLKPESSHSVNGGAEYRPAKWIWLSINVFHNDIEDLIFYESVESDDTAISRYRHINLKSAYTQGFELGTRTYLSRNASAEIGYTLTHTRDRTLSRPLEGRALHRGHFDLRYWQKKSGLNAMVRGSIVGTRPFYIQTQVDAPDETVEADPYATIDLRLAKRFGKRKRDHLQFFVGVKNLLDAGEHNYLPIQPRTFYGGITGAILRNR